MRSPSILFPILMPFQHSQQKTCLIVIDMPVCSHTKPRHLPCPSCGIASVFPTFAAHVCWSLLLSCCVTLPLCRCSLTWKVLSSCVRHSKLCIALSLFHVHEKELRIRCFALCFPFLLHFTGQPFCSARCVQICSQFRWLICLLS